jgi:hypothetical protein
LLGPFTCNLRRCDALVAADEEGNADAGRGDDGEQRPSINPERVDAGQGDDHGRGEDGEERAPAITALVYPLAFGRPVPALADCFAHRDDEAADEDGGAEESKGDNGDEDGGHDWLLNER